MSVCPVRSVSESRLALEDVSDPVKVPNEKESPERSEGTSVPESTVGCC